MAHLARLVVPCAVASALLLVSASAAAAAKPITGKLSDRGYTVLAFSAGGEVSSVETKKTGRFKVRPPTSTATLHLRGPDGVYAGPIVVGRKDEGKRAILGVEAGANLGRVEVKAGKGYAKVARRVPRRSLDADTAARAKNGVPIGAGVFGRVRSRGAQGGSADRDLDGIHEALDIDDDGDLTLDKFDASGRRRASAPARDDALQLSTAIGAPIFGTPNAHAGVNDAQIEAGLRDFGFMSINIPAGKSAELDCGAPVPTGLSYCAPGGTGTTSNRGRPFPDCCDSDDDGFGTMSDIARGPDFVQFGLDHHATTAEIGTGDILTEHLTLSGDESQCPPPTGTSPDCLSLSSMHQYVFATVPAIRSFSDSQGTTTVPYPVPFNGPGSPDNPFPVSATGGDVVLTLTFFRPQRRPTSEAECSQPSPGCTENEWIDMGGLVYTATSGDAGNMLNDAGWCPKSAFSEADPNLGPGGPEEPGSEGEAGFTDRGFRDQAANPTNTFTYTFNLTECLDDYGISFNPGETREFRFNAFTPTVGFFGGSGGVDNATQNVWFRRAS
jgi:hypothetical protein